MILNSAFQRSAISFFHDDQDDTARDKQGEIRDESDGRMIVIVVADCKRSMAFDCRGATHKVFCVVADCRAAG